MRTKTKALKIARIADDKKGENILALDVRKISNLTDFFVLATGQTMQHLRGMCEEIERKMKEEDVALIGMDGTDASSWRVLDYGDVIFHCFNEESRRYFDLEHLWGDAKIVEWKKK
ncbi:ribosome silencing factor [Candidatus Sumerlaeota bacterium]|nr:ribosome silencing factor [Candidatus Sumerlaeota bacterium]